MSSPIEVLSDEDIRQIQLSQAHNEREYKEYVLLKDLHKDCPDDLLEGPVHDRYEELDKKYCFGRVVIPIIRKIIPHSIAADIVGVQPMSGPSSTIFKF